MKQFLLATALTLASVGSARPQAAVDHQGLHQPEASTSAPERPRNAAAPAQPQQSPGATASGPMMQGMMQGMMQAITA